MGFSFEIQGDKALISAGAPGDYNTTFVDSVKKCLAQRATHIAVNLSKESNCLEQIGEALFKLQQLLTTRSQSVLVGGINVDPQSPLVQHLTKAGVRFSAQPPPPLVAGIDPVSQFSPQKVVPTAEPAKAGPVSLSDVRGFLKTYEGGDEKSLPFFDHIKHHMEKVRGELGELLKKDSELLKEKHLFEKRLAYLKKTLPGDHSGLKELGVIKVDEEKILELRNSLSGIRKELAEAKKDASEQESIHRDYARSLERDNNKQKLVLEKELMTLEKELEKAETEFKKKSDVRRVELQKLNGTHS